MMSSFSGEDEEYQFFDAHEDIASPTDHHLESFDSSIGIEYELWTKSPQSVEERRSKFLNWMGLNKGRMVGENPGNKCSDLFDEDIDRIMKNSGVVLRTQRFEYEFSSSRSSMSCSSNDALDVSEEYGSNSCRIRNLGGGTDGKQRKLQGLGLDTCSSSSVAQQPKQREAKNLLGRLNRVKSRWLSGLRSMTCRVDRRGVANSLRPLDSIPIQGARVQRVKVHHCKKRWKELSALFIGQDIQAHKGSILTMKFSLDGQHLATAGEDGIVRVWQVVEDVRSNEIDIPDIDPSCMYFMVNRLSELTPLIVEKEKLGKNKSLGKTADTACVIFPSRVFRILEEPLHQFHGHSGEILDLSWSKNNCLLSSSIDKTVRLWQVGHEICLKVFPHSNYVTCVQFNPVDDNHFVSGSIDGKVRIWAITGCQVVDWTDVKDIITAVCYRPDGQGVIVGSMTGTCRFYDVSDDHFQLEAQIRLNSKKRASRKRIIGFQFFPQDPNKLMVTCADSQIRILHGIDVVRKYKGNHRSASLTSDGQHIVSASEDSHVYIWNCINQEVLSPSQPKTIRSWERFTANASIAIPWSGLKSENSGDGCQVRVLDETSPNTLPFPSPVCFAVGQEFVVESFPKGSATWPEEKLLSSSPRAVPSAIHKSQYKFLRSYCQNTSSSHAWNLVIVTAGWDGRIRSFHNYGLPVPF
ncbi:WD repeat-containing protein [Actinidia chinensis var. chinensis]|uniref:WD repeat-containing protein n=1 Tax=Actinidia chinensis var. chinensis TaxID=1590841 RepID=A0A2R6RSG7_ACTCC|nr:WD repeat-containing protein [Actinidia chinensis var. chinensis]